MIAEMDILGTKMYIWEKNPKILSEIKSLYFFPLVSPNAMQKGGHLFSF